VDSNAELAAQALLRILKTAKLLRTDIEVYELLLNEQPILQLEWHKLHNVILQTLNAFWLDFQTKNIRVNLGTCHQSVFIDYRTVSVVFCHFHDNAVKYILKNSELSIQFQTLDQTQLSLRITMKSLKIHDHELEAIFREGISGEEASKLGLSGTGLGLHVIRRLCNLNSIGFLLNANINPSESITSEGRKYDLNEFVFEFQKFK
jgi:signal transduction histidine kinase